MFFSFIRECFSWLPLPLSIIVNATITVFLSLICFAVIIGIVRSLLRNH